MQAFHRRVRAVVVLFAIALVAGAGQKPASKAAVGADPAQLDRVLDKAMTYLRTRGQAADGSFSAQAGPAVTGLAVTAVLRNGRATVDDPLVRNALTYLGQFVQPDGGIYNSAARQQSNYETSIGLMAFKAANKDGRYDELIDGAVAYLKKLQWDEEEQHDVSSPYYGGAGYGSKSRPDLSNTQILLDAVQAAELSPDDPALQKALVFVSRCQNLESAHNTLPFAPLVNDGGFYYTAAAGGQSQAGTTTNGGLRSYGSMTYAGLKSMIYAGVQPDDPRVVAAQKWIREHYTLDENPNMGQQGLFYYYHTFAKALDAIGEDYLADARGERHDWRRELADAIAQRQLENGSWVNDERRWLEGDPNLVTAYALLALSYCRTPAQPQ